MENSENSIRFGNLRFEMLLHQTQIQQRVHALGLEIAEQFPGSRPLFLCVLKGSFLFAADLMRACPLDAEITFVQLSSYQGMASSGEVRELLGLSTPLKDRDVIVVEDIVDTGRTLYQLLPRLEAGQPKSLSVASFLVKPAMLEYPVPIAFRGFDIEPEFVIGYGLDLDEQARGLPHIYRLQSETP